MRRTSSSLSPADPRGAVFVEKLIVYLPLLLAFFAAWELAELGAAHLVVQRASAAAGRAAVVVLPDDPRFYEGEEAGSYDGARRSDIELAAAMVLSAVPRMGADFSVELGDVPHASGPLDVTVSAPYDCGPVSLMCGEDGVRLSSTTAHAYHGARYAYSSVAAGGSLGALVPGSDGAASFRAGRPPRGNVCDTKCPNRQEVDKLQKEMERRKKDFCAQGKTIAWSGGKPVMTKAQEWAKQNGGQTLEQTPGGIWLDRQKLFSKPCKHSGTQNYWNPAIVWDMASEYFMQCARGTVIKFQNCAVQKGKGALGLNTWENVEKPMLDRRGVSYVGMDANTFTQEALCEDQP
jgi:hypothetical protein